MAIEEPLAGGFGNLGEVVRVGDTVRRPARQSSAAVRALLLHLEACGFDGAPRYLDIDDQGRDVLTFVDGRRPAPAVPRVGDDRRGRWTRWAELLRRFHEATATFDASAVAGLGARLGGPGAAVPVICHNDGFPENVVFRDGRAVALIDFDMAAPGRPFWDLGDRRAGVDAAARARDAA